MKLKIVKGLHGGWDLHDGDRLVACFYNQRQARFHLVLLRTLKLFGVTL